MVKGNKANGHTRFKWLLWYSLPYALICLIFLILTIFLHSTNLRTSKDVTNNYLSSNLNRGIYILENLMKNMDQLNDQLHRNSELSYLAKLESLEKSDYYYAYRFQKQKEFSLVMPSTVDHILLTLPNGISFMHTPSSIAFAANQDFLFRHYLMPVEMSEEEMEKKLETEHSFWKAFPIDFGENSTAQDNMIYNCEPIDGWRLTYFFSEANLAELFFGNRDYTALGFNIKRNGEAYFSKETAENEAAVNTIEQHSKLLNLDFYIDVPNSFYTQRMTSLRQTLTLFSCGGVLLCILLSLYFAFRNSRPLMRLSEALHGYSGSDHSSSAMKNPVNETLQLLSRLDEDKENLQAELMEINRSFSTLEFEYLLWSSGGAANYEPRGVSVFSPTLLLLLSLQNQTEGVNLQSLLSVIEELNLIKGDTHLVSGNGIVLLLKHQENVRTRVEELVDTINRELSPVQFRCGVSSSFVETSKIRFAYFEAENALASRSEQICFFDDVPIQPLYEWESIRYYERLDGSLNGCNSKSVSEFFAVLKEKLEQPNVSLEAVRQACYTIRNILIGHLNIPKAHFMPIYHIPEGQDMSEYSDFLTAAYELSQKIIEKNQKNLKSHNDRLKTDITDFIVENFSNADISLTYISDHFNVSSKYISDFLKEQLGITYTDYLQNLRLSKSQELLLQTDMSVNDIAQMCGFYSANTFYKSFKKRFNLSPSEYKQSHANQAAEKDVE